MHRLLSLFLAAASVSAAAQSPDAERLGAAVAFQTVQTGTEAVIPVDSSLRRVHGDVIALRAGDVVLRDGETIDLAAPDSVVAFERRLGGERRVVATNAADSPRFLVLPGEGVPPPYRPDYLSRDDVGEVPSLVARLDDGESRFRYGLRIPARTTVVFRPAEPADVRPQGLDE